jgi:hypothetical protein
VQVSFGFDAAADWVAPACHRDSNHDHFVSWDTGFDVYEKPKMAVVVRKSLFRASNWS